MAPSAGSNFCSISSPVPPPILFVASAMGRRAKNKQGDPLPLDLDPDLNGSKLRSKPGPKGRFSAPNLKTKLGKRKPERGEEGERVAKRSKGVRPAGKSQPQVEVAPTKRPTAKGKGKPSGEKVGLGMDGATDDDSFVGWEGVKDVDTRAEARCVCLSENVDALSVYEQPAKGHYSVTATQRTRKPKPKSLPGFPGTWKA